MSEENKKDKLKEVELKKVNGGYTQETVYTIYSGECYSDNSNIYKVTQNYIKILETDFVECESYSKSSWVNNQHKLQAPSNILFTVRRLIAMNYEGINYIN